MKNPIVLIIATLLVVGAIVLVSAGPFGADDANEQQNGEQAVSESVPEPAPAPDASATTEEMQEGADIDEPATEEDTSGTTDPADPEPEPEPAPEPTAPAPPPEPEPDPAPEPEPDPEPQAVTVNLSGFSYGFSQDTIVVEQGTVVTVVFTSTGGVHDWVVDAFGVATSQVNTGGTTQVTFTANQAGSFPFYCSVGNHRALGMEGTLVVQ